MSSLSGGNQQKVLLARWLATKAKVLMFDEPTKGVDVGAKAEIYKVIGDLAAEGLGVVVVSSYLPEVLGLADRVLVMREGTVAGELPAAGATEEDVLHLASTGGEHGRRDAAPRNNEETDMPSLKIRGRQAATTLEPATAGAAAPTRSATQEERVLTFGDVFGRDAGGLIVLLVLFGALTLGSDEFLTGDNMANLARQVAVFGIIAVGQLLVILTAGIDLSVGSVLGLTGCITAELLVHGVGIVPAILVGMAAGAAIGVFNGSLVAYGKLPPFIVTLGMLGIARGVVLVLTDASTVQPLPDVVRQHRQRRRSWACRTCCGSSPSSSSIASFVLRRTVFGRYVYAVGSNPESARLAGVPVTRVLVSRLRDRRACSPRSAACSSPRA